MTVVVVTFKYLRRDKMKKITNFTIHILSFLIPFHDAIYYIAIVISPSLPLRDVEGSELVKKRLVCVCV